MRFHLPALPGRSVAKENSSCAYSQKVRKFQKMMVGHEVFIYSDDGPELEFDADWTAVNLQMTKEIAENRQPGDFLGLIGGRAQEQIATVLSDMQAVEYGIGYGGVFTDYRVFESYAWMHAVYGTFVTDPHTLDGRFYDAVIPNYFEPEDFPLWTGEDYLLYVGRLINRKGVQLAADLARHMDMRLVVAGEGPEPPDYGELIGSIDPAERGGLMAGAKALIAPTLYVEPFGGVAVEAQLCGTPVITTDWGAFPETVIQGVSGYRCRKMGEFVWAAENVGSLDRDYIRQRAAERYSLEAVRPLYEHYFEHLQTLNGAGFYDFSPTPPQESGRM